MDRNLRTPVIAANWKMYKTIPEAIAYVHTLENLVKHSNSKVVIAPSFTALNAVAEAAELTQFSVAAQNISEHEEGAYTGDVSAHQVSDAGAQYVILGHSERRRIFHETNALIHKKLKAALKHDLTPIVCVGETLEEHQSGKTEDVVKKQLAECLQGIDLNQAKDLVIAYEPVWAIGTGLTASPEIAQSVHRFIRETLKNFWGDSIAEKIPVIYGGSVKPENAGLLMKQKDIDGLLVGGAALSAETFSSIVNFD